MNLMYLVKGWIDPTPSGVPELKLNFRVRLLSAFVCIFSKIFANPLKQDFMSWFGA